MTSRRFRRPSKTDPWNTPSVLGGIGLCMNPDVQSEEKMPVLAA